MSDGFMADPIRPGDANMQSAPMGKNINQNNTGIAKLIILMIIIIFVAPLIMGMFIFLKVWNTAGDDIIQQIKNGTITTDGYYELDNEQQMAAARIFSMSTLYDRGGPRAISQSDCRYLKNAVVGYYNKNSEPVSWYDNTYCEAGDVGISTFFLDAEEKNIGGIIARIDIEPIADNGLGCVSISFAHNFRYIATAGRSTGCSTNRVEIKPDGMHIQELEPAHGANSDNDTDTTPSDQNILRS